MLKPIQECKENIQKFINRHNLIFDEFGEIGFDRKCVGLLGDDWTYLEYNPIKEPDRDYILELYDERFELIGSDFDSYANCLVILSRGDEAIRRLSEWIDKLNALNITVEEYETGSTGIRGTYGYALKVQKTHSKILIEDDITYDK